jgi:hypothetical protein
MRMRLRSEGSTPTEMTRAPKKPRDSSERGTYKEALTNIKIAIFRETYPEYTITDDDRNCILKYWKGVTWDSNRRTTAPKVLQTGGPCTFTYAQTNSLVMAHQSC